MIKLNYHSGAEISVAENISFPLGSKEKNLPLLMCQAQLYV